MAMRKIDYFLFVTFHNDFDKWLAKNEELRMAKGKNYKITFYNKFCSIWTESFYEFPEKLDAENLQKKLKEIDEMSGSEYEELLDEDRQLYINNVVAKKREESLTRRKAFEDKVSTIKQKQMVFFSSVLRGNAVK